MATTGIEQSIVPLNKGIVRIPSIGAEGELSECINVHPRGGELVNLPMPIEQDLGIELREGEVLVHVHHHDDMTAYITTSGGLLFWRSADGGSFSDIEEELTGRHKINYTGFKVGISRITSLGRCLIIYGDSTPTCVYMWTEVADEVTHEKRWEYSSNNVYNSVNFDVSVRYTGQPINPTLVSNGSEGDSHTSPMDGTRRAHGKRILLTGNYDEENVAVAIGSVQQSTGWGFAIDNLPADDIDADSWRTNRNRVRISARTDAADTNDAAKNAANAYLGLMHTVRDEAARRGYVTAPIFYVWALKNAGGNVVAHSSPILVMPNAKSTLPVMGVTAHAPESGGELYLCPQVAVPAYTCRFDVDLGDIDVSQSGFDGFSFAIYVSMQGDTTPIREIDYFTPERLNHTMWFDYLGGFRGEQTRFAKCRVAGDLMDDFTTKNGTTYSYFTGAGKPPLVKVFEKTFLEIKQSAGSSVHKFTVGAKFTEGGTINYTAGHCDFYFEGSLLLNGSASVRDFSVDNLATGLPSYQFGTALTYNSALYFANYKYSPQLGLYFGSIFGSSIGKPFSWKLGDVASMNGQYELRNPVSTEDNTYNTILIKYKDVAGSLYYKTMSSGSAPNGVIVSVVLPNYTAEARIGGDGEIAKASSIRLAKTVGGNIVELSKEIPLNKRNNGQYSYTTITEDNIRYGSCPTAIPKENNPSQELKKMWMSDTLSAISESHVGGYAKTTYAEPNVQEASKSELTGSEILEMAVATRPVSQGQFGQHPIMLFTDEGIWGVSIADDGSLSARQPVSREVAYKGTILQLDDALSFVSNKGLMLLSGNDAVNVSEVVCGHNTDLLKFLEITDFSDIPFNDDKEFREGLRNAQFIYDSANSAIHAVYYSVADGVQVHYVYDLVNKTWTTQQIGLGDIVSVAKDYPKDLIQIGKKIYSFEYNFDEKNMTDGLILTKPLPLGDPVGRKMLYDLRCVGQKTSADTRFRVVVFLSNDGRRWWRLRSLKGMSAKFYRIMILTHMNDNDTLSGAVLQYVSRMTNKLR